MGSMGRGKWKEWMGKNGGTWLMIEMERKCNKMRDIRIKERGEEQKEIIEKAENVKE